MLCECGCGADAGLDSKGRPKRYRRRHAFLVAPVDRVLTRTDKDESGCWIFSGAKNKGYGVVGVGLGGAGSPRRVAAAHRVVYEALVGPIPEGLTLDHLCSNPACVNPDHLEPVTNEENLRRAWRDGRMDPGRTHRAKTHCPHGHPYDEANTYHYRGERQCRTCRNQRSKRKVSTK